MGVVLQSCKNPCNNVQNQIRTSQIEGKEVNCHQYPEFEIFKRSIAQKINQLKNNPQNQELKKQMQNLFIFYKQKQQQFNNIQNPQESVGDTDVDELIRASLKTFGSKSMIEGPEDLIGSVDKSQLKKTDMPKAQNLDKTMHVSFKQPSYDKSEQQIGAQNLRSSSDKYCRDYQNQDRRNPTILSISSSDQSSKLEYPTMQKSQKPNNNSSIQKIYGKGLSQTQNKYTKIYTPKINKSDPQP